MDRNVLNGLVGLMIGLLLISICFLVFPIVVAGSESIRLATNTSSYTGITAINGIGPTIVFVGLMFTGLFSMFLGGRSIYRGKRRRS